MCSRLPTEAAAAVARFHIRLGKPQVRPDSVRIVFGTRVAPECVSGRRELPDSRSGGSAGATYSPKPPRLTAAGRVKRPPCPAMYGRHATCDPQRGTRDGRRCDVMSRTRPTLHGRSEFGREERYSPHGVRGARPSSAGTHVALFDVARNERVLAAPAICRGHLPPVNRLPSAQGASLTSLSRHVRCSVLGAQCSVLGARCSVLSAGCSVLGAQCSVPTVESVGGPPVASRRSSGRPARSTQHRALSTEHPAPSTQHRALRRAGPARRGSRPAGDAAGGRTRP